MKKLEKYNNVQELKAATTDQKVSAAVVEERHREFASFIHYLRGDDAKPSLANHTPENSTSNTL